MRPSRYVLLLALGATGCSSTPLSYYQARTAKGQVQPASNPLEASLAVASFAADVAYDDQRIVYRRSPYRFDYYHYHRWSSAPGEMVSVALREAYRESGHFVHVVGGFDARADFVLDGRVLALEEVDITEHEWKVHLAVELTLRDGSSGRVLWSTRVDVSQAVAEQTPEGVAASTGLALTRIATATAPTLAQAARKALGRSPRMPAGSGPTAARVHEPRPPRVLLLPALFPLHGPPRL